MVIRTSSGKLIFPPHSPGSVPSHIPCSRLSCLSAGNEALPDVATPHSGGRLLRSFVLFLKDRSWSCGATRAAGKPSISNVLCTSNSTSAGNWISVLSTPVCLAPSSLIFSHCWSCVSLSMVHTKYTPACCSSDRPCSEQGSFWVGSKSTRHVGNTVTDGNWWKSKAAVEDGQAYLADCSAEGSPTALCPQGTGLRGSYLRTRGECRQAMLF